MDVGEGRKERKLAWSLVSGNVPWTAPTFMSLMSRSMAIAAILAVRVSVASAMHPMVCVTNTEHSPSPRSEHPNAFGVIVPAASVVAVVFVKGGNENEKKQLDVCVRETNEPAPGMLP